MELVNNELSLLIELQEAAIVAIREKARAQALARLAIAEEQAKEEAMALQEAQDEQRLKRAWLSGALSPAHGLRRRAKKLKEASFAARKRARVVDDHSA